MDKPKQHGGTREGAGPPRKMVKPVRVTLVIEQSTLDRLRATYGRDWQAVARDAITAAIEGQPGFDNRQAVESTGKGPT